MQGLGIGKRKLTFRGAGAIGSSEMGKMSLSVHDCLLNFKLNFKRDRGFLHSRTCALPETSDYLARCLECSCQIIRTKKVQNTMLEFW